MKPTGPADFDSSVPALPRLWSELDRRARHRRRYAHRTLSQRFAKGWTIRWMTYWQCLLFPLVAVSRLMNGDTLDRRERDISPRVNRLLRCLGSFESRFAHRFPLPIGSSLFVVARKWN
jgi:hypothetical protein